MTVTAGVRFDLNRAISPDLRELDADGRETGVPISGDGLLYTWRDVSPRLAATWKLTDDGRTLLRASYGRFTQGVLTGEVSPDHPGQASTFTTDCVGNVTPCVANSIEDNPRTQVQIDPATRAPRTDAYSVGLDRELGRGLSAGVVYVHKAGRNFIGWEDQGGTYREEERQIDGWDEDVPVHVLTNSGSDRRYVLTNPAGYSMTYDGVAMTVERRRSGIWQALGSYTWSRALGLQPSSGTTAAGAQVATVGAPPVSFSAPVMFGRDPNHLTNADGRLPNDRPHLFRMMGAADVPKIGVTVAASIQYSSGKPWAATTALTLTARAAKCTACPARATRLAPALVSKDDRPASREVVFARLELEALSSGPTS